MKILSIDTSNQTMAIAVIEDKKILGQIQTSVKNNHSIRLMPAIESLMQAIELPPKELDRIVVAQGPGSYTGLRIGVTTAKTLAHTLKLELVGVSSLKTIAANAVGRGEVIVPLIDARRKNVYAGAYRWEGDTLVSLIEDQHIAIEELLEKLAGQTVYFIGEDVSKFQLEIGSSSVDAIINPVSVWDYPNGVVLGELGLSELPVLDVHSFLPKYLKRVEAEEKWLETHEMGEESYVEKI